ncbi:MAG TPA: hypothetical protein VIY54_10960 [Steroidobacteraceae bacterium]
MATPSISGTVKAVVGGTRTLSVTFSTSEAQRISDLAIGGRSLPGDWSGPSTFSCPQLARDSPCDLILTYTPTANSSGTLELTYTYVNQAGRTRSGRLSIPYSSSSNNNIVATASPSGSIDAVIGAGTQSVAVTFTTDDGNPATGLSLMSDLASLPGGWSSRASHFSCPSVSTGNGCQLNLSYAPPALDSGTLRLNYSYTDNAGLSKSGALDILYASANSNSVVGTALPSGQIAVSLGGSQSIAVSFDTNDGHAASALEVTSDLNSLPSGWGTGASRFGCASVSNGNGCQLGLTYAPSSVGSGTVSLQFSYTNDSGTVKRGVVQIPYAATANDNVVGTVAPSGQVNAVIGAGSQSATITFITDDGNAASSLAVTSDLSSLPRGWSSSSSSFGCASISTGNGCQLPLSYAPSSVGNGTLNLSYTYTNDAGIAKSGTISIPYLGSTHDDVVGMVSPSGQIAVTVNATQTVSVTFNTNDGNAATALSLTSDLSSLPSGWSSGASSFSCAALSTGNGCELSFTYAPTAAASGTLNLSFSYLDDAGSPKSGTVSIPYRGTTNDHVIGTVAPAGTVTGVVNTSQAVSVTFITDDGNVASGLTVTSDLSSLPGGWSNSPGSFGCVSVSTGSGCELSLTYAPSAAGSAILTLNFSYTNNAGIPRSGSVSIPYASTANIGGTVSGLNGTVSLQDSGSDTLVLSGNGAFTFATALASGATYDVTVSTQPTGQTCTVANGSGTVSTQVSNVAVSCTTNTYGVGGGVAGLWGSGLMLTDNGGDTLPVPPGASSFAFATQIAYGSSYAVAVSTQPTGQTCTVANGAGTVTGAVTSVAVSCTTNTYNIGGSISGLSQSGLVLTDNGGNALAVSSGAGSFTFSTPLAYGSSYAVAVSAQPTGQTCTVANGSGSVTGTVTSVAMSCINAYTIGGTITGLNVSSVVLANGSATVTVAANSAAWVFPSPVASGSSYSVTVQTQPAGQTCQVTSGGSGTLTGNVSNVTVVCAFGLWTWEGGSSGHNANGVYGTKGTASASNVPGGRFMSVSWIDSSGSLWMFGGSGYASTGGSGFLNDLWEYGAGTGQWTWISGSNAINPSGVYGTKGTASATNVPGGRIAAVSWIDASGNLWLFGGFGYTSTGTLSHLNDLWKYSPSTGKWTWVSGSNAVNPGPVYGTKGVASATNVPGGREEAVSGIDTSGNLWLLGGYGYIAGGVSGNLNDLWNYSPRTGQWTWVSGSSAVNANGVYGTQGLGSISNVPGARYYSSFWIDSSGNFWLFGGVGYGASGGSGDLNDLWKFSPAAGWTWVSGSNAINASGVYGTEGIASASNAPGARSQQVLWIDSSANLWLFAGTGYDSTGALGALNDLWKFSPSMGQWAWISGAKVKQASGAYGTQGTASVTNAPGARQSPNNWIDTYGHLWLFGGFGYDATAGLGDLNDLWQFTPAQ